MSQDKHKYDYNNSKSEYGYNAELDNKAIVNRYELKLIDSIKIRSRTLANISRRIGLNTSIVYELLDGLLLKGYVQQSRKRRMLFWHTDLFSATLDGTVVLERAKRENSSKNETPLKRMLYMIHSPMKPGQ
jgi:DNA-binding MarR family transcriptional regulator